MAQNRLRPGTWRLVETGTAEREIQIDYEKFSIPVSGTLEFEVKHMGLYDDATLKVYRNPPSTVVNTTNVGDTLGQEVALLFGRKTKL
jgi:hypothetical protein